MGKFLGYRTIANVSPITDGADSRIVDSDYSGMYAAIVGAHEIASASIRTARGVTARGTLVNWVCAQVLTAPRGSGGIPHWVTVEVIVLSEGGDRILQVTGSRDPYLDGGIDFNLESEALQPIEFSDWFASQITVEALQPMIDLQPSPTAPSRDLTIDEQIKKWRDNTPLWDRFPSIAEGQSGIYVLGHTVETLQALGNRDDQMDGAIMVFNARRGTVRAYRSTEARTMRIHKLGLPEYGIVSWFGESGKELSPSYAYVTSEPRGARIPDYDGVIYVKNSAVIMARGIVGFYPEGNPRGIRQIESDICNGVHLRLMNCRLTYSEVGYFMNYCPNMAQIPYEPTMEYPEPSPAAEDIYTPSVGGHDWLGAYGANLTAEVAIETNANTDIDLQWGTHSPGQDTVIPRAVLTEGQVNELLAQLKYFSDLVNCDLTIGTIDRAQWASDYALAIMAILG